jgi:hypothetical protein
MYHHGLDRLGVIIRGGGGLFMRAEAQGIRKEKKKTEMRKIRVRDAKGRFITVEAQKKTEEREIRDAKGWLITYEAPFKKPPEYSHAYTVLMTISCMPVWLFVRLFIVFLPVIIMFSWFLLVFAQPTADGFGKLLEHLFIQRNNIYWYSTTYDPYVGSDNTINIVGIDPIDIDKFMFELHQVNLDKYVFDMHH